MLDAVLIWVLLPRIPILNPETEAADGWLIRRYSFLCGIKSRAGFYRQAGDREGDAIYCVKLFFQTRHTAILTVHL